MLLTDDTLSQISKQLDERGDAFSRKISKLEEIILKRKDELDGAERENLSAAGSSEERGAIRSLVGKTNSRALSALRRELVKESQKDRDGVLDLLPKFSADIETTSKLYQSPQQVLGREGLGDARRSELQRQLLGAGPSTMRSMADLAIAEGDRVLAASILAVEDRKPRAKRSIDIAAFANSMGVGEEVATMQYRLEELRIKIQEMWNLNRSFERGVHSSLDKIKLGLAKRALAHRHDDERANRADIARQR